MDKTYQDFHLHDWKNKSDVFVIRKISIVKILKPHNRDSFLLLYIDDKDRLHEKKIPIKRYQCIIID